MCVPATDGNELAKTPLGCTRCGRYVLTGTCHVAGQYYVPKRSRKESQRASVQVGKSPWHLIPNACLPASVTVSRRGSHTFATDKNTHTRTRPVTYSIILLYATQLNVVLSQVCLVLCATVLVHESRDGAGVLWLLAFVNEFV